MIMWYSISTVTTAALMLMVSRSIHGMDWMDSSSASFDSIFDDSDQYLTALARDQEHEMHSPLMTGYKYVSGKLNILQIDQ